MGHCARTQRSSISSKKVPKHLLSFLEIGNSESECLALTVSRDNNFVLIFVLVITFMFVQTLYAFTFSKVFPFTSFSSPNFCAGRLE